MSVYSTTRADGSQKYKTSGKRLPDKEKTASRSLLAPEMRNDYAEGLSGFFGHHDGFCLFQPFDLAIVCPSKKLRSAIEDISI